MHVQVQEAFRASAAGVIEMAEVAAALPTSAPPGEALPPALQTAGREDLELTFLGTGASLPSKFRNVTSIYADFFSKGGLLMDCGEDAVGQLKRRWG